MKSPWKLIGQLILGRKEPELSQGGAESGPKPSEIVQGVRDATEPQVASVPSSSGGSTSASKAGKEADLQVDERRSEGVAFDTGGATGVTAPAIKPEADLPGKGRDTVSGASPPGEGRRPRRNTPGKRAAIKAPVPTTKRTHPEGKPISFDDEVTHVEAEVRTLARQLSEKLRQQNAQLRQMLERFDGA